MRLSALALDYGGTITRDDALDSLVRQAMGTAREAGITVLLVTGRTVDELRRVAGGLHFVDGVIAENGAIVHFPQSGHSSALAPPIPPAFLEELIRRGIPHGSGQCSVDADANEAPRLLDVIRALELPLVLVFNGGRVMTLAQGVSKATGLHTALDTLRLSAHNTVAIGDAENDHELLRLAEVRAAVEWGSPALRAVADKVIRGSGPPAVRTTSARWPTPGEYHSRSERDAVCTRAIPKTGASSHSPYGAQRAGRWRHQVRQIVGRGAFVRAVDPTFLHGAEAHELLDLERSG